MRRLAAGLVAGQPLDRGGHHRHGAEADALFGKQPLEVALLRPLDPAELGAHDAAAHFIAGPREGREGERQRGENRNDPHENLGFNMAG